MSFLNSFDISVSGLTAQRQRLDTVAENIANAQTEVHTDVRSFLLRRNRRVLFRRSSIAVFGAPEWKKAACVFHRLQKIKEI